MTFDELKRELDELGSATDADVLELLRGREHEIPAEWHSIIVNYVANAVAK